MTLLLISILVAIIFGAWGFMALVGIASIVQGIRLQVQPKVQPKRKVYQSPMRMSPTVLPSTKKQQLIDILGVDKTERTLNYIKLFNPDKSELWCIESALADMEEERLHALVDAKIAKKPTVAREVRNQLLSLVNGEAETVDRLLANTRRLNPHKTEQWVWEKVIYDLERDRH
ncbi:MAG: hypothetical protein KME45_27385 [Stenomitos rutilans HA7619-LM2]|jgi:hypothetical protein|nr:hypothetical protein [Stenomitos rutilans HA7619-LM2]